MAAPTFDLKGRTALVTGASSGLGRHVAHVLARAGARVALAARRVERLEAAAAACSAFGAGAVVVPLDLLERESIATAAERAHAALGRIDILVNNAGAAVTKHAFEQSWDDWRTVVDTNLTGAWLLSQAVGRHMAADGGGSIINVASLLGLRGTGMIAPYVTSKHGLVGLTRALAVDFARHRIRVNAIAPGYFITDMNEEFLTSPGGEAMKKRVPMKRFGEMEDLDGPVLLLASDAGRYLTGIVLPVDGGHEMNA
jgi:NAD(P)-dependent dehydrogenase (short-subunit alcohol dehydrogenase family)